MSEHVEGEELSDDNEVEHMEEEGHMNEVPPAVTNEQQARVAKQLMATQEQPALQPGRVNPHIQVKWVTFSPSHVGRQVNLKKSGLTRV